MNDRRILGLEAAHNARDLGGYRIGSDRQTRWGRVYRSGKLFGLGAADLDRLDALQVASLVDLRTQAERDAEPGSWRARPKQVFESAFPLAKLLERLAAHPEDADLTRESMLELYRDLPLVYRDEYRELFTLLAREETPLLVHCSAGKDRTGVACALLLDFLGVARDTVIEDYVLTEQLSRARGGMPRGDSIVGHAGLKAGLSKLGPAARKIIARTDPDYLAAMFERIETRYGSVDAYVGEELGLSDDEKRSLRAHLVEPVS